MALRIGVDLCDDYTVISVAGEDEVTSMPTVICRDKKKEYWHIGEEAYRMALSGKGVLTDKLVSLLKKDGRSTVGDRTYSSVELCTEFLRFALKEALGDRELQDIEGLCLVLHKADPELMDRASEAVAALGLPEGSFRISSHEEALIHYILPKEKELYNNLVAVFDLSEEVFSYYEFRVIRGVGRQTVMCSGTDLEEAFHIDVLKTDSGRKLADHIIAECARKLMDRKIYSSVFLTGKGFSDTEWAEEFKEFICKRRRVIFEEGIFARGAAIYMNELLRGVQEDRLVIFDTRLSAEIGMEVSAEGRQSRLILAPAGICWYGYKAHAEFIPDRQDHADIDIVPVDRHRSRVTRSAGFGELPERPDRCTRLSMDLSLKGPDQMEIRFKDMGFGDFFPATEAETVTEIDF